MTSFEDWQTKKQKMLVCLEKTSQLLTLHGELLHVIHGSLGREPVFFLGINCHSSSQCAGVKDKYNYITAHYLGK